MKYIDWNIKCYCQIQSILNLLDDKLSTTDCIIALQEVMPEKAEIIKEHYKNEFTAIYSMDYREADEEFDTDNRRLGVMLLISNDFSVKESGVFERCLFPERTLFSTLEKDGRVTKVVTLHSITGVSFKMGKAVQFRSFAECLRDYSPDIVSLDANEPDVDHYDIDCMQFFDQGDEGKGARLFFCQLKKMGLRDAYTINYDDSKFEESKPLTTSHIVNGKKGRRYDFVFMKDATGIEVKYLYKESCAASSDHAMIVVEKENT